MVIDRYMRVAAVLDSMSTKAHDAYLKLEFKEDGVAKQIKATLIKPGKHD
jgi:hypothetical protein